MSNFAFTSDLRAQKAKQNKKCLVTNYFPITKKMNISFCHDLQCSKTQILF